MGGRLLSTQHKGVAILTLWPREHMYESAGTKPLARLYRPEYSGVFDAEYALRGLERVLPRGPWVVQRWMIRPTTYADIPRLLEQQP